MTTYVFNTKEQLIEALKATIPSWEKRDAQTAKDHAEAEKAWLKAAREQVREFNRKFQKMPYERAKRYMGYGGRVNTPNLESGVKVNKCPTPRVPTIGRAIAELEITRQKRFTIESRGRWSHLHDILSVDLPAIKNVCE